MLLALPCPPHQVTPSPGCVQAFVHPTGFVFEPVDKAAGAHSRNTRVCFMSQFDPRGTLPALLKQAIVYSGIVCCGPICKLRDMVIAHNETGV